MTLKVPALSFICRNYECALILSDLCITAERLLLNLQKRISNQIPTPNK